MVTKLIVERNVDVPMRDGVKLRADTPVIGRDGLKPLLAGTLSHPPQDDFWSAIACDSRQISIPILHAGGWYDVFSASTLRDYESLREAGNLQQKVLMGPWTPRCALPCRRSCTTASIHPM